MAEFGLVEHSQLCTEYYHKRGFVMRFLTVRLRRDHIEDIDGRRLRALRLLFDATIHALELVRNVLPVSLRSGVNGRGKGVQRGSRKLQECRKTLMVSQ
jgi:hypothetical protein